MWDLTVKHLRLQPIKLRIACKFHFWPPNPGLMPLVLQNTALLLCNLVTRPGMLAERGFNWLRKSHDYRLRISIDWSDRHIKKYIHQFHQLHTYMFIPFIWEFSYRNRIFFTFRSVDIKISKVYQIMQSSVPRSTKKYRQTFWERQHAQVMWRRQSVTANKSTFCRLKLMMRTYPAILRPFQSRQLQSVEELPCLLVQYMEEHATFTWMKVLYFRQNVDDPW